MPVYVCKNKYAYRGMIMCHMVADTLAELHEMAERIGLKREWFQTKSSLPHYDVCRTKRALAIRCGAREVSNRELYQMIKEYRKSNNKKD